MKKYLLLIILLLFPFTFGSCLTSGKIGNVSYYEYKPSNASSSSKVIFAFHGIGASSSDILSFGAYTQIDSIAPNAVVVYPTKGYGVWSASTYGSFVKSYLSQNGYTGTVSYYGFSMGALDGPGIIQNAGVFTNAVFVDEDFINYSSGVDKAYNKLSTIQNLKVFCGQYCDNTNNLNALQQKFSAGGKNFQLDAQTGKNHAQMNSYAAAPGISFLTSASGSSPTVTTTNDVPTTPTSQKVTESGPVTTSPVGTTTDSYRNPTTSVHETPTVQPKWCPLGDDVTKDLVGILRIMKILAPLLVVIYSTYESILALTKGEIDKEQKTLFNKFVKRVGAALLLFVIPILVDQMMQLMNVWDDTGHCVLVDTEEKTTRAPETCEQKCDHIGDQQGRDICYANCHTTKSETCEQKCDHIGDQAGRNACYAKCPSTTTNNQSTVTVSNTQNTTPAIIIIN